MIVLIFRFIKPIEMMKLRIWLALQRHFRESFL